MGLARCAFAPSSSYLSSVNDIHLPHQDFTFRNKPTTDLLNHGRVPCNVRLLHPIFDNHDLRPRSAMTNQERSPLLVLPAELRNKISDFAFDSKTIGYISENDSNVYPEPQQGLRWEGCTWTLACRQLYFEARHSMQQCPVLTIKASCSFEALLNALKRQ